MSKYLHVSNLLERRIRHGDYLLQEFPTDRQLSSEFEVDTRTARKAVGHLIGRGLLVRRSNGRPAVTPLASSSGETAGAGGAEVKVMRLALLTVAYPTPFAWRWQRALEASARRRGSLFRVVTYSHLDDAAVTDTLAGFDGVFFGLPGADPTDHLLRQVGRAGRPVVFLDADLSAHGFPSLWLASPTHTARLLGHLAGRGHRRVACLNTQPRTAVTVARIDAWREWCVAGPDRAGRLIDEPVESFGSPTERAYDAALRVLDEGGARSGDPLGPGGFDATALLCCTAAAAKGVYRALHERAVPVGPGGLAVCSSDDGAGDAPYFIPSLTSLCDPDPSAYLEVCLDWMARGGADWQGPLLVQPRDVPLFAGESTAGPDATVPTPVDRPE